MLLINKIKEKYRNLLSNRAFSNGYDEILLNKIIKNESHCSTSLNYILRTLEFDPKNQTALKYGYRLLWNCSKAHHKCNEPITQEQIDDQRLDIFFNQCSICNAIWIPTNPSLLFNYGNGAIINQYSSTGYGGYCTKCAQAFCHTHVKNPIPENQFQFGQYCPICDSELNITDAFGRKTNQAIRLNKKLYHVILLREGFIAPDLEYSAKVFRNSSPDVFEDIPYVYSVALFPWEYDSENVLKKIEYFLFNQTSTFSFKSCKDYQANIWSGCDTDTNTNLYIVKIWHNEQRVNLQNIFHLPEYNKNYHFETIELMSSKQFSVVVINSSKITKEYFEFLNPIYAEKAEDRTINDVSTFKKIIDYLNSGNNEKVIKECESIVSAIEDYDGIYYWWASSLINMGLYNNAIDILKKGLLRVNRKFFLCQKVGVAEWKLKNIGEAIYWWIQGIHCQESLTDYGRDHSTYLYLYYVAVGLDIADCASAFRMRVDEISFMKWNLNEESSENIIYLTRFIRKTYIREALDKIVEMYFIPKNPNINQEVQKEVDRLIIQLERKNDGWSTDENVKAAEKLGKLGDPCAIEPLTRAVHDISLSLHIAARDALIKIKKANT